MIAKMGTFYGVGVGPGDPDLITLKAIQVLSHVRRIFASRSSKNEHSLALNIVRGHLNDASIELLPFPMTRERGALETAWNNNAVRVVDTLRERHDAAFLTLGDPLTYSTYSYLLKAIKRMAPDVTIKTIPGVTSYHAAAALGNIPLTEGEESFHVISGAMGGHRLSEVIESSENVVMLKTYKHFDHIYKTLEELNLLDRAVCISCCGLEGETMVEDIRALKDKELPYFSLIIIKKKGKGY